MECRVKGCSNVATQVVEVQPEGLPVLQTALCDEHALEVGAGAIYSFDGTSDELLLGDALPLELVTYSIQSDVTGMTITLKLGRGPEVQETVSFRVGRDFRFGYPGSYAAGK